MGMMPRGAGSQCIAGGCNRLVYAASPFKGSYRHLEGVLHLGKGGRYVLRPKTKVARGRMCGHALRMRCVCGHALRVDEDCLVSPFVCLGFFVNYFQGWLY